MTEKRIVVLIPCYNAAATIAETIASVCAAIQTIGFNVPVYLYDDCSKDDSVAIAEKAWRGPGGLIVHRNAANAGERRTTNAAFTHFIGKFDWVFIIHADDIVKKEWLLEMYRQIRAVDDEKCFTVWSSFDSMDGATGKVVPGDDTGKINSQERTPAQKRYYITKLYCNWHISGAALNVGLFHRLNGFDVSMAQFGDTDFFTRGLLAGFSDIYISRTLTWYRVVAGSVSSTSIRTNRDIREIVYVTSKFRDILTKGETRQLYKNLVNISFRRACRWIIHPNPRNFLFCSGVAVRFTFQYALLSINRVQHAS